MNSCVGSDHQVAAVCPTQPVVVAALRQIQHAVCDHWKRSRVFLGDCVLISLTKSWPVWDFTAAPAFYQVHDPFHKVVKSTEHILFGSTPADGLMIA